MLAVHGVILIPSVTGHIWGEDGRVEEAEDGEEHCEILSPGHNMATTHMNASSSGYLHQIKAVKISRM